MVKPHSSAGGGRTNIASCVVATVFLILLLAAAAAAYLILFKPKDPKISVNAVQLPSFSALNTTATFNFSQYVAVRNPNRAVLTHYDSSLQLLHGGAQVGLIFIPAGKIGPARTIHITATFSVRAMPLVTLSARPDSVGADWADGFRPGGGPTMELETQLDIAGRVRVLHFFTHHVEAKVECTVGIGLNDGSVLGVHC